jgi:hypothetical protein
VRHRGEIARGADADERGVASILRRRASASSTIR